jgi:futalosine hydrolase
MRILVVTAVPAERDAVLAAFGATRRVPLPGYDTVRAAAVDDPGGTRSTVTVLPAGVGPAAAAAGAATALMSAVAAGYAYDLVVSAGIGGGFTARAPLGTAVVASQIVAADLGAEAAEGFLSLDTLGFGAHAHVVPEELVALAAQALRGAGVRVAIGPVLTVSTATGSAERAAELARRHPGAAAEGMEGFGVATAAVRHGPPVMELRTVSNPVGPRDRAGWRIDPALAVLTRCAGALFHTALCDLESLVTSGPPVSRGRT